MSRLAFRNIDASPEDPVESWPYEGIVAAIERGLLPDWQRIADAVHADPWGRVARSVEEYAEYGDEIAVASLLLHTIERARREARQSEADEVALRVRQAIQRSGVSARSFARSCGTSAARLSTYWTGKVQPSAAMLVRFERFADRSAPTTPTAVAPSLLMPQQPAVRPAPPD